MDNLRPLPPITSVILRPMPCVATPATTFRHSTVTRKNGAQILTKFLYRPAYSCQTLTRYYLGWFQELGNSCNLEIRRLYRICWPASHSQREARIIGPRLW